MAATPSFTSIVVVGAATLTTGDTSKTAPSGANAPSIFAPGITGGMCERVNIVPLATTTLSVVRLFRYDGTTMHLLFEVGLPAQVVSAGSPARDIVLSAVNYPDRFPIGIPPNATPWTLHVSVNDTQTGLKVQAEGGAY